MSLIKTAGRCKKKYLIFTVLLSIFCLYVDPTHYSPACYKTRVNLGSPFWLQFRYVNINMVEYILLIVVSFFFFVRRKLYIDDISTIIIVMVQMIYVSYQYCC